jgi:galactitol-specific phosphotransferase system IIC component
MATTNSKKRKLSASTVLLLVLRIIPIILEGLNRDSEGNLEVATVQFQFNPFSGKLDAFVGTGLDKDDVHRTGTQTKAPISSNTMDALMSKLPFVLKKDVDISLEIRK